MSSQQYLCPKTPERPTIQPQPYQSFTPCTRLSHMSISRTDILQRPVKSFQERLMEASNREENVAHPNLDMFLSQDKIGILEKKRELSFSEEEEESDDGDLFSSGLCPMSTSPTNRFYTKFEDSMLSLSPPTRRSLFDDEDDDLVDKHYDPSDMWLYRIYHDNNTQNELSELVDQRQPNDVENKPPQSLNVNNNKIWVKRSTTEQRLPLQEITLDELQDEEMPAKKKVILNSGKMRMIRTLSPPRFNTKRKGKIAADSAM
ncbi:hypothetical protein RMCBS344292_16861 [Rhizopus microsporus]|nr:hypothetical protein RMCBS344292_16861 [Rhizopus microsporus]